MKLYLTEKMFGKHIKQIGNEFSNFDEVMKEIANWKNDNKDDKTYKIEKYDRLIHHENQKEIAIDFGDYYYFMLITECTNESETK